MWTWATAGRRLRVILISHRHRASRTSTRSSRPTRGIIAASGLALVLSATTLVGSPTVGVVASDEPGATSARRWLSSLSDWLAPVSRWADPATIAAELPSEGSQVKTIRLKPRPKPGAFSMNLYEKGDFVHQQTAYWCVAASLQTMMNIMDDDRANRSRRFQKRLHFQARDLDRDGDKFWRKLAGESRWRQGLHGLGLKDWAGMLTTNGYGPYEVERAPTLKKAMRMAAKAIRTTGRPVGLVVWRGAHAWVMSGFTATADPAHRNDFRVKKVFVQDPWYPDVSSIWGRSRPPNSALTLNQLGEDYLRYNRPVRRQPMRDGKYMLILPTLPPDTRVK